MPFDAATTFVSKYLEDRASKLKSGDRLKWSTDGQGTLAKMIDDQFDRKKENTDWISLKSKPDANINPLMGLRTQIGWLAGSNRDLRTQFGAGKDCHQRVALDHVRYNVSVLQWAKKGVTRLREIVQRRMTPIP